MKVFILLIMGIGLLHSVSAATHSLHYVYTATSGIPDFPEFVTVGLVNREPISYYDSIIRTETPRQDWMANNEGSDYWESQTQISNGTEQTFKANIDILKQRFNQTGVPPSVFLLQRTPSSPVTCHATGFYPSRVMVTWKKDGQEQYEDVEVGETLQNDDGTFQKSVHLAVKPEEWKNNKYQCVVQVSGINKDFIKDLTESEIQTNRGENDPTSIGLIIGVVVAGLLAIIAAVIGVFIWKKKNRKGFVPANNLDNDSTYSNNSADQLLTKLNRGEPQTREENQSES